MTGEAGSGKTCAALCLIDEWGGWYQTLADYCELLRQAQQGEAEWSSGYKRTEREVREAWADTNLCVLDELGTRNPTDWQVETLTRAIDAREGMPTVYIANLTLEGIDRVYGDRVASRLAFGTELDFQGDQRADKTLRVVTGMTKEDVE